MYRWWIEKKKKKGLFKVSFTGQRTAIYNAILLVYAQGNSPVSSRTSEDLEEKNNGKYLKFSLEDYRGVLSKRVYEIY